MGLRIAIVLLAVVGGVAAAQEAPSAEQLFELGNSAYQEGRFDDAAKAYRGARSHGVNDARLEYNLGNAEFKRGNKGLAILHFERARRLDPTDREILDNLAYARGFIVDRVPAVQVPAWLERLRAWQDALGPDRHAWIVLGALWLFAIGLAWSLARAGRFNAGWGWALGAVLVLIAVIGASGWATYERLDGSDQGVVLAPVVEVLAGPGGNNATLATVHEGLTVEVRDVREEWAQVSLPNGLSGWLPREALGMV